MNLQELEGRLDILLEQGVISERAYSVTVESFHATVRRLDKKSLDNGEMLFTHLPMALTRIERSEAVDSPASVMMEEVEGSANYPKARGLVEFVENSWGKLLPEEEVNFLKLHFTNIFNTNEGDGLNENGNRRTSGKKGDASINRND
ncbi:PRD domain-containing protein [Virgibacillus ihumii]|uniref:PRD domain-containing protein n=1 Tax=Virgibacillus ihumii TaxID=2686091 RepID=UPI00157DCB7C|nr:PRD domain-containing protein [Virgibacillus ihumii]